MTGAIGKTKNVFISAVILLLVFTALNIYTESIPFHLSYFSQDSNSVNKKNLRILSYNIGLKSPYQTEMKDSLKGLIDFFKTQDADILVLPESRIWKKEILRSALEQQYPYSITEGFKGKELYIETYIYCHYPLNNIKRIGNHYIYSADVTLPDNKIIRIVSCHLSSNQWHSSLFGGEGLIDNLTKGYKQRQIEVQDLCDSLASWSQLPTFVCGDMNDFSGSSTLNILQDKLSLQDAWWKAGFGYGTTFASKGLYLRLDHILFPNETSIQRVYIPDVPYSDHYPIVAEFK